MYTYMYILYPDSVPITLYPHTVYTQKGNSAAVPLSTVPAVAVWLL